MERGGEVDGEEGGAPRFVYVSSAGVTRPNRPGINVDEEPPAVKLNDALGGILTYKLEVRYSPLPQPLSVSKRQTEGETETVCVCVCVKVNFVLTRIIMSGLVVWVWIRRRTW